MDQLAFQDSSAAPTAREQLHDLRTLFAVIASGGHMLGDRIDDAQRARIIDAIDDAALRGGKIATALLASSYEASASEHCELAMRVARLEPMLETLVGNGASLHLDTAIRPTLVRCRPERFDHIVLELVANARAATANKGEVTLRMRRVGRRVWILVADTGCGMNAAELRRLLGPLQGLPIGPHGGGLRQIRGFAREADARLKIRSRPGKGTVVALTLPVMLPERMGPEAKHAEASQQEVAHAR